MLSAEEQEQIDQTIEMFEVIVQASPHDCQSMEILKDAYQRTGRVSDEMRVARRLAETYVEMGQFSSALLEYEGILTKEPDNPEIMAALGEVEERLHKSSQRVPDAFADAAGGNLDFQAAVVDTGTLITTPQTLRPDGARAPRRPEEMAAALANDGNDALAKFLIQHRIVSEEAVISSLERVQKKNRDLAPNTFAASLIDDLTRRGAVELDVVLCGILDRSKFAYIPLEYYEVDRQMVRMLPESLTLGRLMVPFDVLSRTVMIATTNPFDAVGKEAVQQTLDYNIQWHLATPSAVLRVLAETYRLALPNAGEKVGGGVQFPENGSGLRLV